MKKKFLFLLSFLLLFNSVYANGKKKMTLNINHIVFEKDFVVKNDRIHIPLRLVSENLGADVNWKGDTKEVEILNQGKKIVFYIDSKEYRIDDMVYTVDSPTFILDDTAYVPARALANTILSGSLALEDVPATTASVIFNLVLFKVFKKFWMKILIFFKRHRINHNL